MCQAKHWHVVFRNAAQIKVSGIPTTKTQQGTHYHASSRRTMYKTVMAKKAFLAYWSAEWRSRRKMTRSQRIAKNPFFSSHKNNV